MKKIIIDYNFFAIQQTAYVYDDAINKPLFTFKAANQKELQENIIKYCIENNVDHIILPNVNKEFRKGIAKQYNQAVKTEFKKDDFKFIFEGEK
jgi:hypothetical protein